MNILNIKIDINPPVYDYVYNRKIIPFIAHETQTNTVVIANLLLKDIGIATRTEADEYITDKLNEVLSYTLRQMESCETNIQRLLYLALSEFISFQTPEKIHQYMKMPTF